MRKEEKFDVVQCVYKNVLRVNPGPKSWQETFMAFQDQESCMELPKILKESYWFLKIQESLMIFSWIEHDTFLKFLNDIFMEKYHDHVLFLV